LRRWGEKAGAASCRCTSQNVQSIAHGRDQDADEVDPRRADSRPVPVDEPDLVLSVDEDVVVTKVEVDDAGAVKALIGFVAQPLDPVGPSVIAAPLSKPRKAERLSVGQLVHGPSEL
jgi:hypothetical protein